MIPHGNATSLVRIESGAIGTLINLLRQDGYTVLGPTERSGAIVYDELRSVEDLPLGKTDEQKNGYYRLSRSASGAFFAYAVGPHSWKRYVFPPHLSLLRSHRENGSIRYTTEAGEPPPLQAFLGVRPCEVHALLIQDRVFTQGPYKDSTYEARRHRTLIIAVNCTHPAGTCFCASMHTGPEIKEGHDLALTEVVTEKDHYFLAEAGTPRGSELLERLSGRAATEQERQQGRQLLDHAAASMGRSLNTDGLPQLLAQNLDHSEWDAVGRRCLACTNCTMVCPTCFCSTVTDTTDLSGTVAERTRTWDSCFTAEFSYLHGGSVRSSIKGRYRQWMTHKLSSWVEQFGTFGCVGCGRCITWCPVGIDITEEARTIREHVPADTAESTKGT